MSRFSLSNTNDNSGRPVAMIHGEADLNHQIIYLIDDKTHSVSKERMKSERTLKQLRLSEDFIWEIYNDVQIENGTLLPSKYGKHLRRTGLSSKDIKDLMEAIERRDLASLDKSLLRQMYRKIREKSKGHDFEKEVSLESGYLQPLPRVNLNKEGKVLPFRECGYIAGCSGSGKSTYVSKYVEEWRKLFPGCPIFLFSQVSSDAVLDKFAELMRIKIDENLIIEKMDVKELTKKDCPASLVIFDDIDVIGDKKVQEAVYKIQEQLLEVGRHENIYVLSTAHQIMNYMKTRTLLNEATWITVFPKSGSTYHIKQMLFKYCGMSHRQIAYILKLPSRWVTIYKQFPNYVIYETGLFFVT